jgi:2-octaprenyl-6-methoxyphenol hydroxylase
VKTYDVIIVGGGLAGSSLALALCRLGLSIALVEASPLEQRWNSPAGERALALAKGSIDILVELGIWPKIQEKATPIQHIHVSDRGHFGKTRLNAAEMGLDAFGQVVLAKELERTLAEACAEEEIKIFSPAEVTGLQLQANAVKVSLRANGHPLCYCARLVVAADGGKSKVRRWVGIEETRHNYGQVAIVGTIHPELAHRYTAYERFTASGPLALLPLPGRACALIWSCSNEYASLVLSLPLEQFEQHLQEAFGWKLGGLKLVTPLRSFPLFLIRAKRLFSERVVLVGNSAHQLHPVAGQGFNLGLRDVAVLTGLMKEYLRHGYDPGAFTLLERYAKIRFLDHERVTKLSHNLVQWFSVSVYPVALSRNLGLIALDHLPLGKGWFARQAMGTAEFLS